MQQTQDDKSQITLDNMFHIFGEESCYFYGKWAEKSSKRTWEDAHKEV